MEWSFLKVVNLMAEIYENSAYISKVREGLREYYLGKVDEPCYGQYCRTICK